MKKILAIALTAILAVALCVTSFAIGEPEGVTSGDQVLAGSDGHDLASVGGNDVTGTDLGAVTEESFFFWGWHASTQKIVEYGYRYGDLVFLGSEKFYHDDSTDAGKADNNTIAVQHNNLTDGADGESVRFRIAVPVLKGEQEVYAVVKLADGTVHDMWKITYTAENGKTLDEIKDSATFVDTAEEQPNPPTADASVIAVAAVACIALAGVVVAKKVK